MKKIISFSILLFFIASNTSHAEITRTLKLGSTGAEVKELQILLNKDPETRIADTGIGSPGKETLYFGSLTKAAVIRFQTKYASEILYPAGVSFPTGVVGAMTRVKLRKLYPSTASTNTTVTSGNTQTTLSPNIESVSPTVITKNPEMLTLSGANFLPTGNSIIIVSDSDKPIGSYNSVDSKTLSFPFSSSAVEKVRAQLAPYKNTASYDAILTAFVANLSGGNIYVENGKTFVRAILLVKNGNGTSNTVSISIDIKTLLQ